MSKRINAIPTARRYKPAKLFEDTHQKVAVLIEAISRRGWEGLGIDRADTPTVSAVIDAAVDLMIVRSQQTGTKGRRS
jgi:hypothetical protein